MEIPGTTNTAHNVRAQGNLGVSEGPFSNLDGILAHIDLPPFEPLATSAQVTQASRALDALLEELRATNRGDSHQASTPPPRPRLQDKGVGMESLPFVVHYMDARIPPQSIKNVWGGNTTITLLPGMVGIGAENYFMEAMYRYVVNDLGDDAFFTRGSVVVLPLLNTTARTEYPSYNVRYLVENTQYMSPETSFIRLGAYLRTGERFSGYDPQWGDIIVEVSNKHNNTPFPDALSSYALQLTRSDMRRHKYIRQEAFKHLAHQAEELMAEGNRERAYGKAISTRRP